MNPATLWSEGQVSCCCCYRAKRRTGLKQRQDPTTIFRKGKPVTDETRQPGNQGSWAKLSGAPDLISMVHMQGVPFLDSSVFSSSSFSPRGRWDEIGLKKRYSSSASALTRSRPISPDVLWQPERSALQLGWLVACLDLARWVNSNRAPPTTASFDFVTCKHRSQHIHKKGKEKKGVARESTKKKITSEGLSIISLHEVDLQTHFGFIPPPCFRIWRKVACWRVRRPPASGAGHGNQFLSCVREGGGRGNNSDFSLVTENALLIGCYYSYVKGCGMSCLPRNTFAYVDIFNCCCLPVCRVALIQ